MIQWNRETIAMYGQCVRLTCKLPDCAGGIVFSVMHHSEECRRATHSGPHWQLQAQGHSIYKTIKVSTEQEAQRVASAMIASWLEPIVAEFKKLSMLRDTDVMSRLRKLIADQLELDPTDVQPGARFNEDLAVDELGILELNIRIEQHFEVEIPEDEFHKLATTQQVADHLEKLLEASQHV